MNGNANEIKLIDSLMANYRPYSRPVKDLSQPIRAELDIQLSQIIHLVSELLKIPTILIGRFQLPRFCV